MADWKRVPTSPEVFSAIYAAHKGDLKVFTSYSNPLGNDGLGDTPEMRTEWGFAGDDFPVCGQKSTWDHGDPPHARANEKHEYWLCVGELPWGED